MNTKPRAKRLVNFACSCKSALTAIMITCIKGQTCTSRINPLSRLASSFSNVANKFHSECLNHKIFHDLLRECSHIQLYNSGS